jgi:short-subunit dehydrogenase
MVKLKPIADQVMVITGASSGIGLETAREAARQGARVLLVARAADTLAEGVAEITAAGGTADYKAADVGDAEAMRAVAAHAVQRFGRIDSWVNNAGTTIYAPIADTPDDEHAQLFRTDYFGVVHGTRAALPHLKAHGGALITVGSIGSDMPAPMLGAYSAAKHAVKAYVEVLRMELNDEGAPVAVSLVKPGGVDTPIGDHAQNHGHGKARIPPPVYDPKLVADAILHCAVHGTREITVGGLARAQVLTYQHFKGVMQWIAPKVAQAFLDPTRGQPDQSNLWHGSGDGRVRSDDQMGKPFSLYTEAAKRPGLTFGLAALVGGAGALWWARRREQSGRQDMVAANTDA